MQNTGKVLARIWLCFIVLIAPGLLKAEVPVPALTAQVVDSTGTLSNEQQAALIQKLQAFEAAKGSQIAVLLVQTTQPEPIEQYALRVAESWKIGRKSIDDGAILVVALQDRALRIEVGYGLEGALTDITSKRIIEEVIIPKFRQGDVAGGVAAGVDQMIKVIEGEPLPEPARAATKSSTNPIEDIAPLVLMLALFLGGFLRKAIGKLPAALATGGVVFVVAWLFAGTIVIAILAAVAAMVMTLFGNSMGGMGAGRGDSVEEVVLVAAAALAVVVAALVAAALREGGRHEFQTHFETPDDHRATCAQNFSGLAH